MNLKILISIYLIFVPFIIMTGALNSTVKKTATVLNVMTIILAVLILGIWLSKVETQTLNLPNNYNYDTENGKRGILTYTDDTDKENSIKINNTKNDAENNAYIETKRQKFLFIYNDENVLHISID